MNRSWIVLGGGGHASVIIDALLLLGREILGFTDPVADAGAVLEVEHLGEDAVVNGYSPDRVVLANGLGSVGPTRARGELYRRFVARGYAFPAVLHPAAVVARSARIGAGAQLMAGSVVQPNCILGENVLVNTHASVDHDCVVGDHVHIAPGATLSGGVVVGAGAHVGVGSSVVQGIRIGDDSIIGAGAVVLHDVPAGATVVGVPARTRAK